MWAWSREPVRKPTKKCEMGRHIEPASPQKLDSHNSQPARAKDEAGRLVARRKKKLAFVYVHYFPFRFLHGRTKFLYE